MIEKLNINYAMGNKSKQINYELSVVKNKLNEVIEALNAEKAEKPNGKNFSLGGLAGESRPVKVMEEVLIGCIHCGKSTPTIMPKGKPSAGGVTSSDYELDLIKSLHNIINRIPKKLRLDTLDFMEEVEAHIKNRSSLTQ